MSDRLRFGLAVALQLVLLAVAPLTRLEALTDGARVRLVTVPVDPYDVMAGYYVTLRYEVERAASQRWTGADGEAWLWLEPGAPGWGLRAVLDDPDELPAEAVAVRAQVEGGRVRIVDADRMYIPEDGRERVEAAVRAAERAPVVELRVDDDGQVVVRALRVDGQVFGVDEGP